MKFGIGQPMRRHEDLRLITRRGRRDPTANDTCLRDALPRSTRSCSAKSTLRRILAKYASYYNEVRTHVLLGKDAPCKRPTERFGDVISYPILGGTIDTFESSFRKRQV